MISLLIAVVVIVLVAWLLVMLVNAIPMPPQINRVLTIIIWVFAVLAIIQRLLALSGVVIA